VGCFGLARATLISAGAVLFATGAFADAIDGNWCSADGVRSFSINGPRIVTSAGIETTGNYSRHAFSFVVPEGHHDAAMHIDMQLLNEQEVRVTEGSATPEVWHRCKPIA